MHPEAPIMPKSPIVVLVKLKGSSESNKTIVVQKAPN
jgi:hypothetical protein